MNIWRHQLQRQRQSTFEVPLATAYLAARALNTDAGGRALLSQLLEYLSGALGACPNRENSVLAKVEAGRNAVLPLDRDEMDILFAAAAVASGGAKGRALQSLDMPVGLGYFDLEHAVYVATLAESSPKEVAKVLPFLAPGSFEQLQEQFTRSTAAGCGLITCDESPTLFAVQFTDSHLAAEHSGLQDVLSVAGSVEIQCRVYVPAGGTARASKLKLHSNAKLALQALGPGKMALSKARPEWLLELHALSMQGAWLHLDCPWFRMVCRLPDISAPPQWVAAASFLPQEWLTRVLGVPETCFVYLPAPLLWPLGRRYSWLAPTDPLTWLALTHASAAPIGTC